MLDQLPDFAAAETVLADFKDPETDRYAMKLDKRRPTHGETKTTKEAAERVGSDQRRQLHGLRVVP